MSRTKEDQEVSLETWVGILRLNFSCKFLKANQADPFGSRCTKKDKFLEGHCGTLLEHLFELGRGLQEDHLVQCILDV